MVSARQEGIEFNFDGPIHPFVLAPGDRRGATS